MVGAEIFVSSLPEEITAESLLDVVAASMGVEKASLTLLCNGITLEPHERVKDSDSMAIRQQLDMGPRVYVCQQSGQGDPDTFFGGTCGVKIDRERLPHRSLATIQAIQETKEFVTQHRFDCWVIYTKLEVLMYQRPSEKRRGKDLLIPKGIFPPSPCWKLPYGCRRWVNSDVWSTVMEMPRIKKLLDAHANLTADRPIPRYQMIVDPNQFVHRSRAHHGVTDGPVWVPCEFDVDADGHAEIVGGSRCHKYPALAKQVATQVLESALPLLAKLRRPQLLLDRRRLQVVFKAQRIILPPKVGENEPEYVGMWHVDGHREDVAAVVLYYYHVDDCLEGGEMEFCGREPFDVLAIADAGDNARDFTRHSLKKAMAGEEPSVPHCKVPIQQGSLLVFSNHQMVHRVLRMINTGGAEASRDFVALFILNPAAAPLVPARCALASSYMLSRTLQPKNLTPENLQVILSLAGFLPADDAAKDQRNKMLLEQLKPTGAFVGQNNVFATGNGCLTMIGWLHHMLQDRRGDTIDSFIPGWEHVRAFNDDPTKFGRGMSEVLSMSTSELETRGPQGLVDSD